MYIILLVYLITSSSVEYLSKRKNNKLFYIGIVWMTVMACLRFGQGTDYISYLRFYVFTDTHSEYGYVLLTNLFRFMGVKFEVFIFFVSLFCMFCTYKVIIKYSPFRCMSLLLIYPTIYLTYYYSTIRQGLVIAIFIGFMLQYLIEGKWKRYFMLCVITGFIHSTGWMFVPLYLIRFVKREIYFVIFLYASFIFGVIIVFLPDDFLSIGSLAYYPIGKYTISWLSISERVVMFFVVWFMWRKTKKEKKDYSVSIIYKVFFVSTILSFVFMNWGGIASRFTEAFRAVYILLIPLLILKSKPYRQIVTVFILMYTILMTCKNINGYISQSDYSNCSFLNYPYISVFNKEDVLRRAEDGMELLQLDRIQYK